MAIVLKVTHGDLPGGQIAFTDNEVRPLRVRIVGQTVIPQRSQTGSLTMVYIGREQFEFDISFRIFQASTLDNLDRIRALQEVFVLSPFLLASSLSTYQVVWDGNGYEERWTRGYREANWDMAVTWQESTSLSCDAVVGS